MSKPIWKQTPQPGSTWRRVKPRETRHVVDRYSGGAVVFVSGRYTRFAHRQTVTLDAWNTWAAKAELVR